MTAEKTTYTIQLQDGALWATVMDVSAVPARPLLFDALPGALKEAKTIQRQEGREARIVKTTVSVEIISPEDA